MEIVIVLLLFGLVAMLVARSKGRSGVAWFLLGVLLGPFSLVVVILPSLKIDPNAPTAKTHVRCPECRELVLQDATVCKHCGSKIEGNYLPFGNDVTPQKGNFIDGVGKVIGYTFVAVFVLAVVISVVTQMTHKPEATKVSAPVER